MSDRHVKGDGNGISSYPESDPAYIKQRLHDLPGELREARIQISEVRKANKLADYRYRQHRSQRRLIYKVLHPKYTIKDIDASVDQEETTHKLWLATIEAQAVLENARLDLETLEDEFVSVRKLASLLESEIKTFGG